jgi:hypothetical protein
MWIRIEFQIHGFDDEKMRKLYNWKFCKNLFERILQFIYPQASLKNAQATGLQPSKEHPAL